MATDAGQAGTAPLPQDGGAGVPQTLTFEDGRFLTISGGNTIDMLSGLVSNDDQQLSYNPATNELTIEDGNTVNLDDLDQSGQTSWFGTPIN